jgi:HSP20 family molecular chaperone IbpA
MNKNIIALVGFILVGIIGYQAYLLDQSSDNPIFKTKKEQPNITVNIEKKSLEKEVRELNQPKVSLAPKQQQTQNNLQQNKHANNIDPKEMFDEELIRKDMGKLFSDIFGNPKLQQGLKDGLKQMQEQLQSGLKDMEKELGNFSQEFEKLSKDDPFFKDLFAGLAAGGDSRLQFTDRGDNYYLKLDIPGGKDSNIDIQTKQNLLTLTITQKITHDKQSKNSTMHSESMQKHQNILLIPDDAFIDKLQTNYENGVLEIIVPKVDKVAS